MFFISMNPSFFIHKMYLCSYLPHRILVCPGPGRREGSQERGLLHSLHYPSAADRVFRGSTGQQPLPWEWLPCLQVSVWTRESKRDFLGQMQCQINRLLTVCLLVSLREWAATCLWSLWLSEHVWICMGVIFRTGRRYTVGTLGPRHHF